MLKTQRVYFLLALCVLFWSGNFVIGRYVKADISPIEMAFFRWFFTLIFISPAFLFLDIKKVFNIVKKNFLIISILSLLGITIFNTIVYTALQTTTTTNALLINSTTPLIILVLSYFILKTKITLIQILGIFISTFGVVFLVLKADSQTLLTLNFHEGDFWIIVSSTVWALYSVLIKFKPKELNFIELFVCTVVLGFIYFLPLYLYQGYSLSSEIVLFKNYWPFFIYVSVFTSIICYYLWHYGIDKIGADKTGQFTHLMPIFGSILAFIFLGEVLEYYHIIGGLFIAIGIYLSLFLSKKIS